MKKNPAILIIAIIWLFIHLILLANSMNYSDEDCSKLTLILSTGNEDYKECKSGAIYDLTEFLLFGVTPLFIVLMFRFFNPVVETKNDNP